jgi:hypothetical protein
MIRKAILSALVLATVAGGALATAGGAQAQQYGDRPWQGQGQGGDWGHRPPPPPPPPERHHHHGNGGAIAGGLAAGVIGGLIGGALANGNGGPVYAEPPPPPPPPPPRCWFEQRSVQNQYDDGWHYENVRVCR